MEITFSKEFFETQIERLRKELIEVGLTSGFNSTATLKASQKLDELIVEYQKRHR